VLRSNLIEDSGEIQRRGAIGGHTAWGLARITSISGRARIERQNNDNQEKGREESQRREETMKKRKRTNGAQFSMVGRRPASGD
jgi:hypothetical protein